MRMDEAKEAALISSFTQAKEENCRRPYEVGIVVRRQIRDKETTLFPPCSMKPGIKKSGDVVAPPSPSPTS